MPPSPSQPSSPCRPETPSTNSRPQTPVSRPQTPVNRPHTPSSRTETSSSRLDTNKSPGEVYLTLPSLSRPDSPSTSSASNQTWCRQYKISKSQLSRSVLTKLEAKEELTTSERRHLLDAIYNDVTKYAGGIQVHHESQTQQQQQPENQQHHRNNYQEAIKQRLKLMEN
ncbi:unnamed protein product [Mytilus coruscus]|uniref:Uncharacterized protein n=1 Tax=Mytilus coruscus TaxID=42192 RepID=A0A6J8CKX7_MYTCO|nr:unnamed protein product [Mytilus coruscus]